MFSFSLDQIASLLQNYGYQILFPLSIIEGPIVSIIAGFVVSLGYLNFYITGLILLAGDIIGDVGHYALGRWSRHKSVMKIAHYLGFTRERAERFEATFKKHEIKLVLIGKIQAFGSFILFSAGIAKMPFGRFFLITTVTSFVKVIIFLWVGYHFGQAIENINKYFDYFGVISIAFAVILIAGYLLLKKLTKVEVPE